MTQLYAELWGDSPLAPVKALQQAQLKMLRDVPKDKAQCAKLNIPDVKFPNDRLPPFYWAAFVLSGE